MTDALTRLPDAELEVMQALWALDTYPAHTADIAARLEAGADILNVSGASKTPDIVAKIRSQFPDVPIIATGGPRDEDILRTIQAGANAITYTPPTTGQLFADIMINHRRNFSKNHD